MSNFVVDETDDQNVLSHEDLAIIDYIEEPRGTRRRYDPETDSFEGDLVGLVPKIPNKKKREPYVPYFAPPRKPEFTGVGYILPIVVFIAFMILAPFGVSRIVTLTFGIIFAVGALIYEINDTREMRQFVLKCYAGTIVGVVALFYMLHLILTPQHFALVLTYILVIPIALVAFSVFASVVETPLGNITPANGVWGYVGLQAFIGAVFVLILSAFDGGEVMRIVLRDLFYLIHWDWVAWLLDTDGSYINPWYDPAPLWETISASDSKYIPQEIITGCADGVKNTCSWIENYMEWNSKSIPQEMIAECDKGAEKACRWIKDYKFFSTL